eukprot:TRINITY_DN58417_c0_g1_i1.p1 TRINITY_DN58417_c0_g1~~TRINITY_DN58417_c0_g1_i1.p1  ORF type:complete len:175 (-),score=43.67 TRINITY_DN58417_c0_g1_i1:46-519(-)
MSEAWSSKRALSDEELIKDGKKFKVAEREDLDGAVGKEGGDHTAKMQDASGPCETIEVEDEESSDEEEDEEEMSEASADEVRREFERERVVRAAIEKLMARKPEGFPLEELPSLLESIKVSNFTPRRLGYPSLRAFIKCQPKRLFKFDRKKNFLCPP